MTTDKWWVYIVQCSDHTLYCGISVDVSKRVNAHNTTKRGAKYTRSRRPVVLVCSCGPMGKKDAMKLEREIKGMSLKQKMSMLTSGV